MKIKFLFVFGFLLAAAWAEDLPKDKVAEPEKVIATEAAAEVNLGNLKSEDENVNKTVDENVEETENGVSASGMKNKYVFNDYFEIFFLLY